MTWIIGTSCTMISILHLVSFCSIRDSIDEAEPVTILFQVHLFPSQFLVEKVTKNALSMALCVVRGFHSSEYTK